ncbi:MAG: choice-of-anchor D domain-containing protein [Deltaproteobacteria bacterium]|nr:choice-of-anchor D domain-containing protein [Deltaproteobacteria bacterium]
MTTLSSLILANALREVWVSGQTPDPSSASACGVEGVVGSTGLVSLPDLLSQGFVDPASALLRRAEFFAGRSPAGVTKELSGPAEGAEAVPLQNCSNVTVSVGSISFGDQRINTSNTRYFTINNPNCCAVNYTISGGAYGFTLSSSGGTIPANGSVSVSVTFTPTNEQYYSGSISVSPGGAGVNFSGRGIR